jgi:plastocyanin domain-containing protein
MNVTDWIVVAAGLGAIVWVNWYFFLAPRRAAAAVATPANARGTAEVRIVVRGGYEPATVRVPAGRPVRLVFDRQETSSCSEEVVFPAFGIKRFLPAHQQTTVEITPPAPGRYEFTCGMAMLHGAVVAEA